MSLQLPERGLKPQPALHTKNQGIVRISPYALYDKVHRDDVVTHA